ncbi:endoplasmic reticulum aminopeptidase 2-like [Mizuhopecten yessoensis]|uniref:Aminopeptidase n=1 Tax=Mizuhopecten yessoensis TaxID=6573 RepID=A0A210Q7Y1_MIZYE|nr:endoplasmic reticulum aminopeptidase 2-like [Mizuhopecten yessoensis]OWF44858.1 Endoplasmic reticulum aminopeptidase 2 [Mizuhopecten yessoensis]
MSDDVEDVSFLPGDNLHRKAVYEPSVKQKCRQLVLGQGRATAIVVGIGIFILVITLIAAFARPGSQPPQPCVQPQVAPTTDLPQVSPKPNETKYLATDGEVFPWQQIRLPRSVIPMEYDILIHPDFLPERKTFKGSVKIKTVIMEKTEMIIFHVKHLTITNVSVQIQHKDGGMLRNCDVKMQLKCTDLQMYVLKMAETLMEETKVTVTLEFDGMLVKKLSGFYLSSYKTPDGEVKYLGTTQFESTGAREAFPCFDEPDMKAKFTMSIVRDQNQISLSNMPRLTSTPYNKSNGLIVDKFQQSVGMSTYLVAFIVCDYDRVNGTTEQGTKVSVYAPPHQISQANFALDTAIKVLNFYNKLFGIKYPLPKQDLVAIPDFAAGAMENWGLITYRLTTILYDPEVSSARDRQYVAIVIAHELAHQWFGNLVTLKWWNDLWLNEGFASFVEYLGANETDPSFSMMDQFVLNDLMRAMSRDCVQSSHPITVDVKDPAQIDELFDAISYSKGASLIRMLSNFMGKEKFQDGIKKYLNTYKYGNARTEDLWDILTSFTQINVSTTMDTWTQQMGYPVVTMNRSGEFVQVTQERFLLGLDVKKKEKYSSPFNYKWNIPFRYAVAKTSGISDQLINIHIDSGVKFQADHDQVKWMKGNYGMYGYYRVNYEESNWRALIKQLTDNHTVFSAADRAGLIDDVCYLARAKKVSQTLALDMTKYLQKEQDYLPWSVALDCLNYIGERLRNKAVYDKLQKYTVGLMGQVLARLGWKENGPQLDKFLRSLVINQALAFGHKPTIEKGKNMFENWMYRHDKVNVNLKSVIYRAGVQYGGLPEWDFIWQKYLHAQVPTEKEKLLVTLCRTQDTNHLARLLEEAAKGENIRHQDLTTVVGIVSINTNGQILAWRFVQQNWNNFLKWFGSASFILPSLVKSTTSSFSTEFDYEEVSAFFKSHESKAVNMSVEASLESIRMNIDWLEDNEDMVTSWLNNPKNSLPDNR